MIYLRKIKSRNKEYFVLIHSIRKGKKIIQKTRYIGKLLPSKPRIEQIKKEFLKEITLGKTKFFSESDLEKIEHKRREYKLELNKLNYLEKQKKLEEFTIRFTYDSNKLAGVDITLRQTFLILKEGVIPEGIKNLKTAKELENHEKGVLAITKYKGNLDIKFLKRLHKILLSGVNDYISGKLRSELKKDVKLAGTTFIPPKWNNLINI